MGLAALALWTAWRPVETHPATPLVLAAVVLLALPGRWRREDASGLAGLGLTAAWLALSALAGPDTATGLRQLGLLITATAVAWVAATRPPSHGARLVLALGLAGLSVWAVWQLAVGFERALGTLPEVAEGIRAAAAVRLTSGRAFASLLLPGHFAVLEVLALALLAPTLASRRRGRWLAGVGAALAVVGLVAARSPIGIALAGLVGIAYATRSRRRGLVVGLVLVALVGIAVIVAIRPDMRALEPVRLRFDNWRTALWLTSSSPVSGVGFGGYGLASATVPLELANRPAHAHCLPLELAAELGVAGWLAAMFGGWWLVRVLARSWSHTPDLALAVAVVTLHNLVDFSAYTSGVLIPAAVVVGWAIARPRGGPQAGVSRAVAITVAAAATAVALLNGTSAVLDRAAVTASASEGLGLALQSARLAPWASRPLATAGAIAVDSWQRPSCAAALAVFDRATALRHGSAHLAALECRLRTVDRDSLGAASAAWRGCRLQPPEGRMCADLETLLASLEGPRVAATD